jgi:benzil reductase ((S)-benzoin forming)
MTATLEGRVVAIVTGHSRGLGAAVQAELRRREVRVLGISRSAAHDPGLRLQEVALDLSSADALDAWLATPALEEFLVGANAVLLVNNAGVLQPVGPLETQEPATVSRAVAINVGAALALSAAVVHLTPRAKDRRILHVSSGAARNAYSGWSVYCATKAALDHHARAVALDRSPGVRIASVAPGVIDTAMQEEIRETADDLFRDREKFVKMKEEGSLRSPAEAARALVEHLLSPEFGKEPVTETRR